MSQPSLVPMLAPVSSSLRRRRGAQNVPVANISSIYSEISSPGLAYEIVSTPGAKPGWARRAFLKQRRNDATPMALPILVYYHIEASVRTQRRISKIRRVVPK
jgi:hypothetical protein